MVGVKLTDDEAMKIALGVLGVYLEHPHHPLKPSDAIVRAVHAGHAAALAAADEWLPIESAPRDVCPS